MGSTYLFRYVANVSGGGVQWSKQGKSTILREDFKLFAPGHEWRGTYRLHLTAEAAKILREDEKQHCAGTATLISLGLGEWIGTRSTAGNLTRLGMIKAPCFISSPRGPWWSR